MKITNKIFKDLNLASFNQRSENFTIDFIISSILGVLIAYISPVNLLNSIIIYYTVRFIYYFIFEYYLGRTLGKFETQTKVVNIDKSKPSIFQLVIRNSSRFFSLLSAVDDEERAIHDMFSKTFVIADVNLTKKEVWNILEKIIKLFYILLSIYFIYQFINYKSMDTLKIFMPLFFILIMIGIIKNR